jgi:D-arabinose 1-dehydrogenase-like Zn-dependent alcohol dehydrogenase
MNFCWFLEPLEIGASGNTGMIAIQLAKKIGAKVTAKNLCKPARNFN